MNAPVREGEVIVVESRARREDPAEKPLTVTQPHPLTIVNAAVQRGASVEEIGKLMELAERFEANEARKAFNDAFSRFKAEAVTVIRNRTVDAGPLKDKKYAELFSVVNAVTPALSKHGLGAAWKITKDEKDWIEVSCTLKHTLGHSESVSMGGPPDSGGAKSPIQARASTISYLERYTLKAICGVAEQGDDNDGNGGKREIEPDPEGKKALEACGSMAALQTAWKSLSAEQRKTLNAVKEQCKQKIADADRQS